MAGSIGRHLFSAIVLLWTIFTVVTFVVISVLIVREPGFPLGLGWVQTRGLAGLWTTLPSALVGIAGLVLLWLRPAVGKRLLLAYSGFWAFTSVVGLVRTLPTMIRHPLVICANGTCDNLPFALGVAAAFSLSAFWCWRQVRLKIATG